MRVSVWPLLVVVGLCVWGVAVVCGEELVVPTTYGPVADPVVEEGVLKYLGIPFAAPPVGSLRFTPPQPPTPWTQPRSTNENAPGCAALFTLFDYLTLGSEDCLYLNVFRPEKIPEGTKLPVMVWIHGGGFVSGSTKRYDGSNLARLHNVIFVAIPYRVGILGFIANEALLEEYGSTGSLGIQDQRFALQWVQENIAAFGGDPDNVMAFGESAGGISLCAHLVSPASRGLFHSVAMESSLCDSKEMFRHLDKAIEFTSGYSSLVGCNTTDSKAQLKCLRGLNLSDLLSGIWLVERPPLSFIPKMYPVMPWAITIDGTEQGLQGVPLDMMLEGKAADVPIIIGTNKNEGSIFMGMEPMIMKEPLPMTDRTLTLFGEHFFNHTDVELVLSYYPASEYKTVDIRAADILGDAFFVCPTRRTVRALAAANKSPVYDYYFNFDMKTLVSDLFGDYHSSEIAYVMDKMGWLHGHTAEDAQMASIMSTFWANLAKYGDPNEHSAINVTWPPFTGKDGLVYLMNLHPEAVRGLRQGLCDLWDDICKYGDC